MSDLEIALSRALVHRLWEAKSAKIILKEIKDIFADHAIKLDIEMVADDNDYEIDESEKYKYNYQRDELNNK